MDEAKDKAIEEGIDRRLSRVGGKAVEEGPIQARIEFKPYDPLYHKMVAIRAELGLVHWSEVLRVAVKRYRLEDPEALARLTQKEGA